MPGSPAWAFSMPMFRSGVPERIRPWIYLLFAFCFQFTGGVYLAALNEIIGERALMREDVLMCLYANLAGMAIYFPLLFRMKFRFKNRTLLLTASGTLAIVNLIVPHITFLPLLWAVCFLSGIMKIQGTFECISNIQLWITPKRDFCIFFPVLHIVIMGSMQISDFIAAHLTYYFHWHAMHWFMAGVMMCVFALLLILVRPFRHIPKMPLLGVDWLGGLLWGLLALQVAYIFTYGDWYDWYASPVIQILTGSALITLGVAIGRMIHVRHAFYEKEMWTYKHLWPILLLIIAVEVLLATEHVLEKVFFQEVMRYDLLTEAAMDKWSLLGVLCGSGVCLVWLVWWKFNYYKCITIGLAALALYLGNFYLTMASHVNVEMFYFPAFCRGFASTVLSATFMICLNEIMTFQHFFQALSVFNMIHMALGGVVGCALYSEGLSYYIADNLSRYSFYIDHTSFAASSGEFGQFMEGLIVFVQAASLKTLYGWALYGCLLLIALFLLWDRPFVRSTLRRMPSWHAVRRWVKRDNGKRPAEA